MGLDGFSLSNLMLNRNNTSKENAIQSEGLANSRTAFVRSTEQVEEKQNVDTEDRNNPNLAGGFSDGLVEDEEDSEDQENFDDEIGFEGLDDDDNDNDSEIKLGLGQKSKEEKFRELIKDLNPGELSKLIKDINQISGIFVNKKI